MALPAPASTGTPRTEGYNWQNGATGMAAGGALGGLLGGLFGGKSPGEAGMPYLNELADKLPGIFGPYMKHGEEMYGPLSEQLSGLMSDPGGRLNQIGAGYHQSPGYQFALNQALQGAGHAAAAGGMAGTPQHQQQAMQVATGLADQDYNNWMKNALGMYGQGLQGGENIYGVGANAAGQYGNALSQALASQAQMAAADQQAKNQQESGFWGGLGTLAGSLFGL